MLLALALLSPLTVDADGHSFLVVARSASWSEFGDWVATWCSLKVILLGLSLFLIAVSAIELLITLKQEHLARMCGLLLALPIVTLLLGCYYLIKALL